jgi:RNA polymerase sigma factor for flagellar operon FliA
MSQEEFLALRSRYMETKDIEIRNKIILGFRDLPKIVASQFRNMAVGYAQLEDMISQGMLMLIDCIEKFDDSRGMKFESYAYLRIRGAIIDLMRKQDWVTRRVRKNSTLVQDAYNELSHKLLREPTDKEMSDFLEISEDEYFKMSAEISSAVILSFEDMLANLKKDDEFQKYNTSTEISPDKKILDNELKTKLATAIDELSEREKQVVSLYYYNDLQLNEVAQVLGVTPQRASAIHTKAIIKLSTLMQEYLN